MKVIILGAGIAGLTMANACQRAGMHVQIYEQAKTLTTIGGGIFLWPHGLRFLDELGLSACFHDARFTASGMNIISHKGERIFAESHAELYKLLDGEILPIDRSYLQQQLVHLLAVETLFLNKQVIAVDQKLDCASVTFADGSVEEADLIVGADGIHSAVRSHVLPNAKAQYSGYCCWGGIIDRDVVPHFPEQEVQIILGKGKLCTVWPLHNKRFMWYLPVKMPLHDFSSEPSGFDQAKILVRGWNDDVMRIVSAPQCAQHFHVPIDELPPQSTCVRQRTVLIGDAALSFGPLLGQGANKAIEDAYLLTKALQQVAPLSDRLAMYDRLRKPRHQRFFELEHMSAEAMIHETEDALNFFVSHIPLINLKFMYQDIIPLVDRLACSTLKMQVVDK